MSRPEIAFRAALAAHAPLVSIVGTRIAQNAIPEGPITTPLVVWTSSHDVTLGLGGAVLADKCSLDVQCWCETAAQADTLADAVTSALADAPAQAGAAVIERSSGFDPDIGKDAVFLTVEWWAD